MGKIANCKYCGAEFTTSRKLRAYCSQEHKEAWIKEFTEQLEYNIEKKQLKSITDTLVDIPQDRQKLNSHYPPFTGLEYSAALNADWEPVFYNLVAQLKVEVVLDDTISSVGQYNTVTKKITINPRVTSYESAIQTLIHEAIHYLVDQKLIPDITNIPFEQRTHFVDFDRELINLVKNETIAYTLEKELSFYNPYADPNHTWKTVTYSNGTSDSYDDTSYGVALSCRKPIGHLLSNNRSYFEERASEHSHPWFTEFDGDVSRELCKYIAGYYSVSISSFINSLGDLRTALYYILKELELSDALIFALLPTTRY